MRGKENSGGPDFPRNQSKTIRVSIIAVVLLSGLLWGESLSVATNPPAIDYPLIKKATLPIGPEKGSTLAETARIIAAEQGLSPKLVDSIIRAESNGDPKAVSHKGAMGLMQLMPGTAKEYQVFDPFDPVANIRGGIRYLKDLLERFSGNLSLALAAYNAGPGAVKKYQGIPPFAETHEFVRKVEAMYVSEGQIPSAPVLAPKIQATLLLDKGSGKIVISGSPREVVAFLKFIKKDKPEVHNR